MVAENNETGGRDNPAENCKKDKVAEKKFYCGVVEGNVQIVILCF